MSESCLPEVTKKRLVQLLQILRGWTGEKITSVEISAATGWKDNLIRHDLWLLGYNKGVSNGYFVHDLLGVIRDVLEVEKNVNCCVVGLGRLGAALLDNQMVEETPFEIKAGFDSNLYRVEILRSTFPLYPISDLNRVCKSENIEYAILTVQNKDAQMMCEKLLNAGIKGIVNMTNVVLKVPSGVRVENVSIANALLNII